MRQVNLSRIAQEQRREAWERLRRKYPAQAGLVQSEFVQQMRQAFDAQVIVVLPDEESEA